MKILYFGYRRTPLHTSELHGICTRSNQFNILESGRHHFDDGLMHNFVRIPFKAPSES